MDKTLARRRLAYLITNAQDAATNLNAQVHWGALLWDVPDVDEPGFCPLQIISNTMVSNCMHVMLVVVLFIT